jgi:uncharacterized protein
MGMYARTRLQDRVPIIYDIAQLDAMRKAMAEASVVRTEPVDDPLQEHTLQEEDVTLWKDRLRGYTIVDTDVHMDDTLVHLVDYIEPRAYQKRLEAVLTADFVGKGGGPLVSIGHQLHLGASYDKQPRGGKLATKADLLQRVQSGLVDYNILFPSQLLSIGYLPETDWACALASAYNAFMVDVYGGIRGIKIAIIVAPQDPDRAISEIVRHGSHADVVAINFADCGVNPSMGHMRYWPIYEAAQDAGLPICFHGSGHVLSPNYPIRFENLGTLFEVEVIGFPFTGMMQMMSLIAAGLPVRLPKLRYCMLEAGVSWLPFLMYRMDTMYRRYRSEVPILETQPSEYFREYVYVGTQDLDVLPFRDGLARLLMLAHAENNTMWASDWPHQERDLLGSIMRYEMSDELRRKVLGLNALRFFGISSTEHDRQA